MDRLLGNGMMDGNVPRLLWNGHRLGMEVDIDYGITTYYGWILTYIREMDTY